MAKYTATQRSKDWRFLWATPEGRRAISDLFGSNGIFQPIMAPLPEWLDPADALPFYEGRRNVALDIINYLKVRPQDLDSVAEAVAEVDGGNG